VTIAHSSSSRSLPIRDLVAGSIVAIHDSSGTLSRKAHADSTIGSSHHGTNCRWRDDGAVGAWSVMEAAFRICEGARESQMTGVFAQAACDGMAVLCHCGVWSAKEMGMRVMQGT
jgi:hypothetical protein